MAVAGAKDSAGAGAGAGREGGRGPFNDQNKEVSERYTTLPQCDYLVLVMTPVYGNTADAETGKTAGKGRQLVGVEKQSPLGTRVAARTDNSR